MQSTSELITSQGPQGGEAQGPQGGEAQGELNIFSFKVNMEKRMVYKFPTPPEKQKIKELRTQLFALVATYDEIIMRLSSRDALYKKNEEPRYEEDDIRELKDNMVNIQNAIKIIFTHLERYREHLHNKDSDIQKINYCIEQYTANK